jgi:hypothetical protein
LESLTVDVRLYGELSCYAKSNHHTGNYSNINARLPLGSTLKDLMDDLLMCTSERGFTFINEKMSAMPNAQSDLDYRLQDGDRVIFFPFKTAPNQLHFDMKLTDRMKRIVRTDDDLNLYYFYE